MGEKVKTLNKCCRFLSMFSIDSKLVSGNLKKFSPDHDEIQSTFLEKLAHCQLETLPSGDVDVISYDDKMGVEVDSLSPDKLFVRKFYPDLLEAIRKNKRSVLTGNPGIGKSFFQFYYFARIMNPSLFGPLPPDCYGSTAPPKIVIRQEGTSGMTIYDIANCKADRVSGNHADVLRCFDPETSLYLMEPGISVIEPYLGIKIPTLTTVSPQLARYKEFCKNGGVKLYMPAFKLPELLAIGAHLLASGAVPEDLRAEYTPERIENRFEQFGGIMRHVLPVSLPYIDDCQKAQRVAITKCDTQALLVSEDIEDADVSHFIMQYDVKMETKKHFREVSLNFVNDRVFEQIETKLLKESLHERQRALICNDETGFMEDACPKIYEGVIAELLTSQMGVCWHKREVSENSSQGGVEWAPFELRLDTLIHGSVPSFADMEPRVLYMSLNPKYPFFDSMYKTDEGELVGIQVTREKNSSKDCTLSALQSCLKKIDFPDDQIPHIRTVLVPLPSNADTAKLNMNLNMSPKEPSEGETKEEKNIREARVQQLWRVLDRYEVWKVPTNYGNRFNPPR